MKKIILASIISALVVVPALGQSLNIDYGDQAGQPPPFYAAAGAPGEWNLVSDGPGVARALVGLDGKPTDATISHNLVFPFGADDPGTSGFDETLLDDGLIGIGDVAFNVWFEGLQNGTYELLTCAWTPDAPFDETLVMIGDDVNGGLIAGGPWPGSLEEGVTHVRHQVQVVDGTLMMTVVGGYFGATGFLNGIQLVLLAPGCDVCSLPPDPGPCEGLCPRYYFDPCSAACQEFIYGCCEGNANNFETLQDCQATCPQPGDICYLPADVGPCDGVCPRYFFNSCSGQCELFMYGCCDGNANNFETLADCQATCPAGQGTCGDVNNDGTVNVVDLLILLASWGICPQCPADLDGNGLVNVADLLLMLAYWG